MAGRQVFGDYRELSQQLSPPEPGRSKTGEVRVHSPCPQGLTVWKDRHLIN